MTEIEVIGLQDVTKTYVGPPPVEALSKCDLRVGRGDYVTVMGPSGSGKSTLLNLIGLLDRPTTGTYRFNGMETGGLPEKLRSALRGSQIGFVFQTFQLVQHRTATENVAMGLLYTGARSRVRRERAREALRRVGLVSRAEAPPSQLSGGERQRVAIARALVHEPALLLCDEPTGNLDSSTASQVLDLIDRLHADGHTIVMITHDPTVAARGERTFAIHDGAVDSAVSA